MLSHVSFPRGGKKEPKRPVAKKTNKPQTQSHIGAPTRVSGKRKSTSEGAASCASAVGSQAASTGTTQSSGYMKWHESLNIELLLGGQRLGVQSWHARLALSKMKDADDGGDGQAEALLLNGHINLYQRCESLLPKKVHTLTKSKREALCRDLELSGFKIPAYTALGIVRCAFQEMEVIEAKVSMLTPGEGATFNWRAPLLRDCSATDLDEAKLLQKCITDVLIGLISKGKPSKALVDEYATAILNQWLPLVENKWSPMLKGALTAVTDIGIFFRAILGTPGDLAAMEVVMRVAEARRGSQLLIRQAAPC